MNINDLKTIEQLEQFLNGTNSPLGWSAQWLWLACKLCLLVGGLLVFSALFWFLPSLKS